MGIDAGFDMVPRLTKGAVDMHNWEQFIKSIESHYKDDMRVEVKQNYILFKTGEHPSLPFAGHKLLRFSTKASGSIAAASGVEAYIDTVTRIAKVQFGSRVQYWNEGVYQYGPDDWDEVNESIRSYEQRDEPEVHTSIASSFINGTDPMKEFGIPLFDIKDIPGKGRGVSLGPHHMSALQA
ncbi:hypothetical protein EJ07DRAFT_132723 [Lizonia empirigonia]|nr:hypothetical protein EJ07DRAFT_132723 [Lizonia empirigonia]